MSPPRLAVRAVITQEDRLLLVNAFADPAEDLWCCPGGGVLAGADLPANLAREVYEETGLTIAVGPFLALSEFRADSGFHQVDLFFAAHITQGTLDPDWADPEGVVRTRRFVPKAALGALRVKPDFIAELAFGTAPARYRGMARMVLPHASP